MTAHSKIYTTAGNGRRPQKSTESHRKPQETIENERKPRKQYKSLENKRQPETAENQRKPEKQRKPKKTTGNHRKPQKTIENHRRQQRATESHRKPQNTTGNHRKPQKIKGNISFLCVQGEIFVYVFALARSATDIKRLWPVVECNGKKDKRQKTKHPTSRSQKIQTRSQTEGGEGRAILS